MIPNELLTDERAVSPVVGVALLIAMTVILAAVIGAVVLGIGVGPADSPQATLSFESTENASSGYDVDLVHKGGSTLNADEITVNSDGGTASGLSDDMSSGDREEIVAGASSGDNITVIWEDPGSDQTTVLAEYTV